MTGVGGAPGVIATALALFLLAGLHDVGDGARLGAGMARDEARGSRSSWIMKPFRIGPRGDTPPENPKPPRVGRVPGARGLPVGLSRRLKPEDIVMQGKAYGESLEQAVDQLRGATKVMVLSGAGMSTTAGIPDFRSPGGLYESSAMLLDRVTYLEDAAKPVRWQRQMLENDVKNALTLEYFSVNPLPYHEMRRGLILGSAAGQWKCTIGHVFPEVLNRNGKLQLLASQNIDGLDHKVVSDKSKLYNPHGLISVLVSEPLSKTGPSDILSTDPESPVYKKYVELVRSNIKDIYADLPVRQGRSIWPGPPKNSTPITLAMLDDVLGGASYERASKAEAQAGRYSVKPGSVQFDRPLWTNNAAGEECDAFGMVEDIDLLLIMGTSLSGLTIDYLAHSAGPLRKPRIVFDMTTAPVDSIKSIGPWSEKYDSLLRGSIDKSILDVMARLGWLDQLYDFLPYLCLSSLKLLKDFVATDEAAAPQKGRAEEIERAIAAEVERERGFYGEE